MDGKYCNLTLQEKTELSNKYIYLYRESDQKKFKEIVFDIVSFDVRKFVRSKFYMFPNLFEDITQEAFLLINKYVNKGSSFDPNKGVYIVIYLQNAIGSAGMTIVDKMKTPVKYDIKRRQALVKKLQSIAQEHNLQSIKDAIPMLIDEINPSLTGEKRRAIECEIEEILNVTSAVKIPDDKQQDDDSAHYELVDEKSDFTHKLDDIYEIKRTYHVARMLFEKKALSLLQFKTFHVFIYSKLLGRDDKKSDLARMLGMTRQNFCRALNEAIKIVEEYIKKHSDND